MNLPDGMISKKRSTWKVLASWTTSLLDLRQQVAQQELHYCRPSLEEDHRLWGLPALVVYQATSVCVLCACHPLPPAYLTYY